MTVTTSIESNAASSPKVSQFKSRISNPSTVSHKFERRVTVLWTCKCLVSVLRCLKPRTEAEVKQTNTGTNTKEAQGGGGGQSECTTVYSRQDRL